MVVTAMLWLLILLKDILPIYLPLQAAILNQGDHSSETCPSICRVIFFFFRHIMFFFNYIKMHGAMIFNIKYFRN